MMKMGPNDASGVVWALGEPFFRIFLILTMILLYIEIMFPPSGMKRARTMVYTIVRAVGMFFFSHILSNILTYSLPVLPPPPQH